MDEAQDLLPGAKEGLVYRIGLFDKKGTADTRLIRFPTYVAKVAGPPEKALLTFIATEADTEACLILQRLLEKRDVCEPLVQELGELTTSQARLSCLSSYLNKHKFSENQSLFVFPRLVDLTCTEIANLSGESEAIVQWVGPLTSLRGQSFCKHLSLHAATLGNQKICTLIDLAVVAEPTLLHKLQAEVTILRHYGHRKAAGSVCRSLEREVKELDDEALNQDYLAWLDHHKFTGTADKFRKFLAQDRSTVAPAQTVDVVTKQLPPPARKQIPKKKRASPSPPRSRAERLCEEVEQLLDSGSTDPAAQKLVSLTKFKKERQRVLALAHRLLDLQGLKGMWATREWIMANFHGQDVLGVDEKLDACALKSAEGIQTLCPLIANEKRKGWPTRIGQLWSKTLKQYKSEEARKIGSHLFCSLKDERSALNTMLEMHAAHACASRDGEVWAKMGLDFIDLMKMPEKSQTSLCRVYLKCFDGNAKNGLSKWLSGAKKSVLPQIEKRAKSSPKKESTKDEEVALLIPQPAAEKKKGGDPLALLVEGKEKELRALLLNDAKALQTLNYARDRAKRSTVYSALARLCSTYPRDAELLNIVGTGVTFTTQSSLWKDKKGQVALHSLTLALLKALIALDHRSLHRAKEAGDRFWERRGSLTKLDDGKMVETNVYFTAYKACAETLADSDNAALALTEAAMQLKQAGQLQPLEVHELFSLLMGHLELALERNHAGQQEALAVAGQELHEVGENHKIPVTGRLWTSLVRAWTRPLHPRFLQDACTYFKRHLTVPAPQKLRDSALRELVEALASWKHPDFHRAELGQLVETLVNKQLATVELCPLILDALLANPTLTRIEAGIETLEVMGQAKLPSTDTIRKTGTLLVDATLKLPDQADQLRCLGGLLHLHSDLLARDPCGIEWGRHYLKATRASGTDEDLMQALMILYSFDGDQLLTAELLQMLIDERASEDQQAVVAGRFEFLKQNDLPPSETVATLLSKIPSNTQTQTLIAAQARDDRLRVVRQETDGEILRLIASSVALEQTSPKLFDGRCPLLQLLSDSTKTRLLRVLLVQDKPDIAYIQENIVKQLVKLENGDFHGSPTELAFVIQSFFQRVLKTSPKEAQKQIHTTLEAAWQVGLYAGRETTLCETIKETMGQVPAADLDTFWLNFLRSTKLQPKHYQDILFNWMSQLKPGASLERVAPVLGVTAKVAAVGDVADLGDLTVEGWRWVCSHQLVQPRELRGLFWEWARHWRSHKILSKALKKPAAELVKAAPKEVPGPIELLKKGRERELGALLYADAATLTRLRYYKNTEQRVQVYQALTRLCQRYGDDPHLLQLAEASCNFPLRGKMLPGDRVALQAFACAFFEGVMALDSEQLLLVRDGGNRLCDRKEELMEVKNPQLSFCYLTYLAMTKSTNALGKGVTGLLQVRGLANFPSRLLERGHRQLWLQFTRAVSRNRRADRQKLALVAEVLPSLTGSSLPRNEMEWAVVLALSHGGSLTNALKRVDGMDDKVARTQKLLIELIEARADEDRIALLAGRLLYYQESGETIDESLLKKVPQTELAKMVVAAQARADRIRCAHYGSVVEVKEMLDNLSVLEKEAPHLFDGRSTLLLTCSHTAKVDGIAHLLACNPPRLLDAELAATALCRLNGLGLFRGEVSRLRKLVLRWCELKISSSKNLAATHTELRGALSTAREGKLYEGCARELNEAVGAVLQAAATRAILEKDPELCQLAIQSWQWFAGNSFIEGPALGEVFYRWVEPLTPYPELMSAIYPAALELVNHLGSNSQTASKRLIDELMRAVGFDAPKGALFCLTPKGFQLED